MTSLRVGRCRADVTWASRERAVWDGESAVRLLQRWLSRAGERLGAAGTVALRVVDAPEMAALNRQHMGKRGPTDVLSFPAAMAPIAPLGVGSDEEDISIDWPLGDIVLCQRVVCEQASQDRLGVAHCAAILTVHGLCHLLGHDHDTRPRARQMLRAERRGLASLNMPDAPRPYGDGRVGRVC